METDAFFISRKSPEFCTENSNLHPNILAPFLKKVDESPENKALWVDDVNLSYFDLWTAARPIIVCLNAIKRGKEMGPIAIVADRSLTSFLSIIAALACGIPYVPIHPKYPKKRQIDILDESGCSILILDLNSSHTMGKVLPEIKKSLAIIWVGEDDVCEHLQLLDGHKAFLTADARDQEMPELSAGSIACVLFTSGSTGKPKGIAVSHSNILSYVESVTKLYKPTVGDRFSQIFDQTFDLSLHDMFVAWSSGASLYCVPDRERHAPGRFINQHSLTVWFSTPSTAAIMESLKLLKPGSFPTLRLSLFCGEPLSVELAKSWMMAALNSKLVNLYGPTETTIAITEMTFTKELLKDMGSIVPIGLPFAGQVAGICNSRGEFLPLLDGSQGELMLSGDQVTMGYWRDKVSTRAKFLNRPNNRSGNNKWFRTGDRVVYHNQFGFQFLGRLDDQIKIRGHRVEISEIEGVLRKITASSAVAVIPWPQNPTSVNGVVAFIMGAQLSGEEIKKLCRRFLPLYMVPQKVILLRTWPTNSSSKTDKKALLKILEGGDN